MAVTISIQEKVFEHEGRKTPVLNDIELSIASGEFLTVIGPSGCGKSTLLKLIAGLDTDYKGSVAINGRNVSGPGIRQGFIFQEHRLFPWLTVKQNIAADLNMNDPAVRKKVDDLIEVVRLQERRTFIRANYPAACRSGLPSPEPFCVSRRCCF